MSDVPTKTCASCGRTITWRKKWARSWDDVRYCSDACRKRKVTDVDERDPKPASTQSRSRVLKVCRSSRSAFALKGAEEE